MKQNLGEKIKNALAEIPEERALFYMIGGMAVTLPMFIVGSAYAFAYITQEIPKVVESVSKNPLVKYAINNLYEALLGVAGVIGLGIGTYKYIERKMHVAETLDDFIERAKKGKESVEVQFQWGYDLRDYGGSIKVRSGKIRYNYYGQSEVFGTVDSDNSDFGVGIVGSGLLARGKATSVLGLIETTICLAEHLENEGLEVKISGGTIVNGPTSIDGAKEYLAACKGWVKNGNAFIIG